MSQTGEGRNPDEEPDKDDQDAGPDVWTKTQGQLKCAVILSGPKSTCRDLGKVTYRNMFQ